MTLTKGNNKSKPIKIALILDLILPALGSQLTDK